MPDTLDDLERKITQPQALLSQYEHTEALEDDPRRRMRTQETIEEIKTLILGYQTRLAQLRRDAAPEPPPTPPRLTTLLANAPYGLEAELVGRQNELLLLDDWFRRDPGHPFLAIVALGGMGKSALTWAWLQELIRQKQAPPLAVWWSFYETDGTMDKLMVEVLRHFGDDPRQFPNLRAAVNRFVEHLRRTPALLILDGAERLLRAYGSMAAAYQADESESGLEFQQARQCVDPVSGMLLQWLAQPGYTQAMTLMTSRLFPLDLSGRSGGLLQGVRRHDLTGLSPAAALHLFHGLGVRASRAEVEAVGGPLGYHPLSLRLLAGYAAADPQRPNDLSAAAAYDPTSDLLGKRQHILTQAYHTLPAPAQHTLSRLAAFRGGVSWPTIETIFGGGKQIRNYLALLDQRGLIQRTVLVVGGASNTVYDLHPIVRRYAYERLADRAGVHTQLVVYFQAIPEPEKVRTLADLAPTIELYHHLARAGRFDEARVLYEDRLTYPLYFQLGAYQQAIELLRALFPDGEDQPPRLSEEDDQGWTLNELANSYSLSGRPAMAAPLFEQDIAIVEKAGDKKNLAIDLGNLAHAQLPIGALKAAEANLRRSIDLCREIEDRFWEAVGHQELGRLLAYHGDWAWSVEELTLSTSYWEETGDYQGLCIDSAYRALAALLRGEADAAGEAAREALRLADETARTIFPSERDYIRAYWLLGWAALAGDDLTQAQSHLDEALRRCRAINDVYDEPSILLAQARLAHKRGELAEAQQLAEGARQIAERAGYRLNLAEIHNFLAHLALAAGKRVEARQQAQQARDYAWCDGPPYAYQVALEEANRLLRELGVENPPPPGRG